MQFYVATSRTLRRQSLCSNAIIEFDTSLPRFDWYQTAKRHWWYVRYMLNRRLNNGICMYFRTVNIVAVNGGLKPFMSIDICTVHAHRTTSFIKVQLQFLQSPRPFKDLQLCTSHASIAKLAQCFGSNSRVTPNNIRCYKNGGWVSGAQQSSDELHEPFSPTI